MGVGKALLEHGFTLAKDYKKTKMSLDVFKITIMPRIGIEEKVLSQLLLLTGIWVIKFVTLILKNLTIIQLKILLALNQNKKYIDFQR